MATSQYNYYIVAPDSNAQTPGPTGPQGPAGPAGPTGPQGVPGDGVTGTIVMNAAIDPPAGWVNCDGTNYLRAGAGSFSNLWTAIGKRYSVGYGSADFNLCGSNYTISGNVCTVPITISAGVPSYNRTIGVGAQVEMAGFVAATGPDINGLIMTLTSVPPVGDTTSTAPYVGTFNVAQANGTGGVSGTIPSMTVLTFQVPNTQALTIRGTSETDGTNFPLGFVGGNDSVVLTQQQLPSHAHNLGSGQGLVGYNAGGFGYGDQGNIIGGSFNATGGTVLMPDLVTTATALSNLGTAINIRNSYITFNFIIKT
jgi:microcystin-dependent protein